jgi:ADP-heptose:LPS heptosyltransferase
LGHEIIVVSEYIGIDVLKGLPALSALIQWYPGNNDYEYQIEQYIRQQIRPDLAIASVPIHGTSQDRFLACASDQMNYGKIEKWTQHEVEVNLNYARQLGWSGGWEPCEFFISDEDEASVEEDLKAYENSRPIVTFHFGCVKSWTWIYKRWHLERFIEVARRLHDETGCYILLVGGPMERDEADQFKFSLSESIQPYVIDKVNRISLKVTGAWIRKSNLFISNDSGPMHIAAAVGTPVVAVFGMSNEVKNGPWTDPRADMSRVLHSDLWCRPCYGSYRHRMCERGDCLADISVDWVYENALEYLQTRE